MTAPDTPVAFVQINLEFQEARQSGDISGRAYCLGLHLACKANFLTKRVTASITSLIDDLEWDCSNETVRRHLGELREHGFIEHDVRPGERTDRRGYKITVTPKLVYDRATSTQPPQDLLVEEGDSVEVTSTQTSTDPNAGPDEIPGSEKESGLPQPPQQPPQGQQGQERYRDRKKDPSTTVKGKGDGGADQRIPAGSQSRPAAFTASDLPELEPPGVRAARVAEAERLLRKHRDIAERRA